MATKQHPKEIKYQNTRYKYVDGGILFGYVKDKSVEVPDQFPWINWGGKLMPYEMWQSIIRFFKWSYDEHKSESLVYLYYNEKEEKWMAWAPPQEGIGMTVKAKDDHPNFKQSDLFKGYIRVGTGHHHCSAGAFASGTDKDDEKDHNGFHFTVGKLDEGKLDLHFRATFNGNVQVVDPSWWISLPDGMAKAVQLAPQLEAEAYNIALKAHAPKEMEVNEQWKANFFHERQWQGSSQGSGQTYQQGKEWHPHKTWDPATGKYISKHSGSSGTGDTARTTSSQAGPYIPALPVVVAEQSAPTSESHGGVSAEDLADFELSKIVDKCSLGTAELRRIQAALCNEHYRSGLKGEDEIEGVLRKHGFGPGFLLAWINDNDQWAEWAGQA